MFLVYLLFSTSGLINFHLRVENKKRHIPPLMNGEESGSWSCIAELQVGFSNYNDH